MGMFSSFYDANGIQWQTKALDQDLKSYRVGDAVPAELPTCQMRVIGGAGTGFDWGWVTVRDGILTTVPARRNKNIPAVAFHGGPFIEGME